MRKAYRPVFVLASSILVVAASGLRPAGPTILAPAELEAQEPPPVVYAVLFYSSTCPHCHQVITEFLIPFQNQYAGRVHVLGFETSSSEGNSLYWGAIRHYGLPEEKWVVPILVVGDEILIGGDEIPARLPSIVEEGLASGGIDLPDFDTLLDFLRSQDLLDTRYPDRRVMRQASPSPEANEEPRADSVAARDSAVTADSALERDSATAGERAVAGDSSQPRREPPATDSAGAGSVRPADSPATSGVTRRDSAASEAGAGAETEAGAESGAGGAVTILGPEVPGPDSATAAEAVDSANVAGAPSSPGTPGPSSGLDLTTAAREMEAMTLWGRFSRDRAGNSLAVLVLLALIVTLFMRGYPPAVRSREWPGWVFPTLVVVGSFVAAYLSLVELTHAEAVCGPVGDCNTVNQSEYAFLFGVLPVGVLGLLGYGTILLLWLAGRFGPSKGQAPALLALWGAVLGGTIFSLYLTFLEPFVIGATCAWCLTSAMVMALLLWATAPLAASVWPKTIEAPSPE